MGGGLTYSFGSPRPGGRWRVYHENFPDKRDASEFIVIDSVDSGIRPRRLFNTQECKTADPSKPIENPPGSGIGVVVPGENVSGAGRISVAGLGRLGPFELDVSRLSRHHATGPILKQPSAVSPGEIEQIQIPPPFGRPKARTAMKPRGRPPPEYGKLRRRARVLLGEFKSRA